MVQRLLPCHHSFSMIKRGKAVGQLVSLEKRGLVNTILTMAVTMDMHKVAYNISVIGPRCDANNVEYL